MVACLCCIVKFIGLWWNSLIGIGLVSIMRMESVAEQLDYLIASPLALATQLAHFTIVISGIKQCWGEHTRLQPFATWFTSLACCFGGSTLVNLFCGKPALASLLNTQSIMFASVIWWLVFYCPKNAFSSLVKMQPIAFTLLLLKEMIRTRKIIKGVAIARSVYPSSLFLCTIMGMLSACGGGFIKAIGLTMTTPWNKNSIKEFHFAVLTKCCLIFSLLYNLQLDGTLPISQKEVVLLQVTFLYAVVISEKLGFQLDPFRPFEVAASSVLIDYPAFGSESAAPAEENSTPAKTKTKSKTHRKEE